MEFTLLISTLLITCSERVLCQKLDITAFEYSRRVPSIKDKNLGHCVNKIEELFPGTHIHKTCTLGPKTGHIRYIPKELNDTRNFEVQNINDIFVCLGLCDGHASSLLGLLHGGDCLAVEIAGKLTFSSKTYIQAYVEYYRSGIEVIQTDGYYPLDLQHHFEGNFYLRDRSYGTMEVVILEMRYPMKKHVETLKASRNRFQHLSSFFQNSINELGKPSSVKLVRLSTAKEEYELLRFKKNKIDNALYKIQQYESEIHQIRYDIQKEHIKPHLRYGMYPYTYTHGKMGSTVKPTETLDLDSMYSDDSTTFICSNSASRRSSDHLQWEEASVAEVKIDATLKRHKRLSRKCTKIPVDLCSSLPNVKKTLKKIKVDIHSYRSKWNSLDDSTKKGVSKINREMKKSQRELVSLSKRIREALKLIKKANRKRNKKERKPKQKKKERKPRKNKKEREPKH